MADCDCIKRHPARISRRVLWKDLNKEGIPDNHTDDDTFLREVKTNINLRTYTYKEAICGSSVLIQQLSLVVFFVLVYALILQKHMTAIETILGCTVILGFLHAYYRSLICSSLIPTRKDFQTFIVIYGFAFGVSPVLSTLTRTVSTDSIYTMVAVLLFVSLIVHDYGPRAMVVSGAFSLNAAFGAAVCLASRLPSSIDTFALIICAVGIFGLWPGLRSVVKPQRPRGFLVISAAMVLMDGILLLWLSRFWLAMFVGVICVVGFLCPGLLIWLQKWKTTIHGPWDEAELRHEIKPSLSSQKSL